MNVASWSRMLEKRCWSSPSKRAARICPESFNRLRQRRESAQRPKHPDSTTADSDTRSRLLWSRARCEDVEGVLVRTLLRRLGEGLVQVASAPQRPFHPIVAFVARVLIDHAVKSRRENLARKRRGPYGRIGHGELVAHHVRTDAGEPLDHVQVGIGV